MFNKEACILSKLGAAIRCSINVRVVSQPSQATPTPQLISPTRISSVGFLSSGHLGLTPCWVNEHHDGVQAIPSLIETAPLALFPSIVLGALRETSLTYPF